MWTGQSRGFPIIFLSLRPLNIQAFHMIFKEIDVCLAGDSTFEDKLFSAAHRHTGFNDGHLSLTLNIRKI